MAIDIPNGDTTAGIAGSWTDTITQTDPLITGDRPGQITTDEWFADNVNIPALTPVVATSGRWNVAAAGAPAAGITTVDIVTGANSTARSGVFRAGVFNPDRIKWPASYDTPTKKRLAFEGAPSPTQIVIRRPTAATFPAP
jgi:hypothetical protein